jgi:hypothetical protein
MKYIKNNLKQKNYISSYTWQATREAQAHPGWLPISNIYIKCLYLENKNKNRQNQRLFRLLLCGGHSLMQCTPQNRN